MKGMQSSSRMAMQDVSGLELHELKSSHFSSINRTSPETMSNFKNLDSFTRPLVLSSSLLMGIASLFILIRVYVKTRVIRKVSWDDRQLLSVAISLELWMLTFAIVTLLVGYVSRQKAVETIIFGWQDIVQTCTVVISATTIWGE